MLKFGDETEAMASNVAPIVCLRWSAPSMSVVATRSSHRSNAPTGDVRRAVARMARPPREGPPRQVSWSRRRHRWFREGRSRRGAWPRSLVWILFDV